MATVYQGFSYKVTYSPLLTMLRAVSSLRYNALPAADRTDVQPARCPLHIGASHA